MGLASDEFKINVAADGNAGTFEIIINDVEVVSASTLAEQKNNLKDYDGIIFEPDTIPVADDIGYNRELVQRFFQDNGESTTTLYTRITQQQSRAVIIYFSVLCILISIWCVQV